MTYSLTERKRIRKSFAKRAIVQKVPFLIATQLESYTAFLQAHMPPEGRKNEGLQAAFTSIFPIVSHSQNARLEFVSYSLGEPPFDVKECQQRGLTYASPLRAKVRLVILDMEAAGLKKINAPDDFILGRTLGHNVINKDTGEIIANANDEITETLLQQLRDAKVDKIQTLFTNDLDQGPYISQTLRADETADLNAARVAIYRMMRPGEPPTEDAVETLFNGLFFAEERYDLSAVGRMKFNRRIAAPSETSWQLRLRSLALPKEAEEDLRAYFKHA